VNDDQLAEAIAAASRALVGMAARSIHEAGADITLPQFRVLVVLATRGTLRMSALAVHLELAPSSTTRLIERLERKDLVERRASPGSRREVDVAITESGQELIDRVMDRRREAIGAALAGIPLARRQAMLRSFLEFAEAVGEPTAPAPRRPAPA
jgi:DNA-binding MarR family transcriptional regulator